MMDWVFFFASIFNISDFNFDINNFDALIEKEYGKIGSDSRNDFDERAYLFIISEMLKEARKEAKMTQKQLAENAGTQ